MQDEQQALNKSGKKQNKFVKFLLKSWQPVPTWQSTIILFTIIGLALVIFGAVLMAINASIVEVSKQYDYSGDDCYEKTSCTIKLTIDEKMEQPVFVYYEIDNFYQNHRRYIKSKSSDQLSGKIISKSQADSDCDPLVTNKEMGLSGQLAIDKITPLVDDEVAIPCGLIAKSVFTDTYSISFNNVNVPINEKGIAWPSDLDNKFKNTDKQSLQWYNMEDEHFVVWMRTAGLPDFRKLWGKIEQDLAPGDYQVTISNTYPVDTFDGKKKIVLSTSGPFGGKNYFLAISYLVVGGVCLLIAVFFGIRWKHYSKKNL